MEVVATRVTRLDKCRVRARLGMRGRYEAWVLSRDDDDPSTDMWFFVGRTWTHGGARQRLRRFEAARRDPSRLDIEPLSYALLLWREQAQRLLKISR